MKRFLLILLVLAFLGGTAYAGPVAQEILAETDLDDTRGCVSSRPIYIHDYFKVAFFVNYSEADADASLSTLMTVQISYDGVNWRNTGFFDYDIDTAAATARRQVIMTCPRIYYCWLELDVTTVPRVRLVFSATGEDATHIATISANVVGTK